MKQVVCAALLAGILFLPAMPAAAKPLDESSSDFEVLVQSSAFILTLKEWFDRFNNWLEQTLGIDLYQLARIVFDFAILLLKLVASIIWQIITQLREVLAL
jgi:hypothetical protein